VTCYLHILISFTFMQGSIKPINSQISYFQIYKSKSYWILATSKKPTFLRMTSITRINWYIFFAILTRTLPHQAGKEARRVGHFWSTHSWFASFSQLASHWQILCTNVVSYKLLYSLYTDIQCLEKVNYYYLQCIYLRVYPLIISYASDCTDR